MKIKDVCTQVLKTKLLIVVNEEIVDTNNASLRSAGWQTSRGTGGSFAAV